eukprot:1054076-Amphidinium_carterae.1
MLTSELALVSLCPAALAQSAASRAQHLAIGSLDSGATRTNTHTSQVPKSPTIVPRAGATIGTISIENESFQPYVSSTYLVAALFIAPASNVAQVRKEKDAHAERNQASHKVSSQPIMSGNFHLDLQKSRVRAKSSTARLYGYRPYPVVGTCVQVTERVAGLDSSFGPCRSQQQAETNGAS